MIRLVAIAVALSFAASAHALTRGTPVEYDDINWSLSFDTSSAASYAGCTNLTASVTSTFRPGALATVNYGMVCNGVLNPNDGRYTGATVGAAVAGGIFDFSPYVGDYIWTCEILLPSLSGTCQIDLMTGHPGQVTLTLVP